MPDMQEAEAGREAPIQIVHRIRSEENWFFIYHVVWTIVYYAIGVGAVVLGAVTAVSAANKVGGARRAGATGTPAGSVPTRRDVITAGAAAALAFLQTGLDANKRADHFDSASGTLASALAGYDGGCITFKELVHAEQIARLEIRGQHPIETCSSK